MAAERLNVIGLVSGGKDSFFSLLHCIEHGHRLVALANLYPATDAAAPPQIQYIDPAADIQVSEEDDGEETDLNSFMYQTVGHQVLPLHAAATGIPLYRRAIHGGATRHERDYDYAATDAGLDDANEETESMIPLLRAVMAQHPGANAVCAGAILSTYQRTRVESVALRLGLTPLAYLWKYTILPGPSSSVNDAQLLEDMAAVDLDARIIKVASAGLDDNHLWLRASSHAGAERVKHALRMFGAAQGAALGEGGEFETLVVDGPSALFKRKINVPDSGRRIISEGGGTYWLKLRQATLEDKEVIASGGPNSFSLRRPPMLSSGFQQIFDDLVNTDEKVPDKQESPRETASGVGRLTKDVPQSQQFSLVPDVATRNGPILSQTRDVVTQARRVLSESSAEAGQVCYTIIVLRKMSDFPEVNREYAQLFPRANPPSRVTIACGDLLPSGVDIAFSLSVPLVKTGRQGLHVQSRSYWAPANIGPYSQAIVTPVTNGESPTGLRCVSIAGQIPLIPATMLLPEENETSLELQVTLSLQHLWRIGSELDVQFWSSAVAYVSKSTSDGEMQERIKLASLAWEKANSPAQEDEDDGGELDPWDLKHNARYMMLGDAKQTQAVGLPDWSALTLRQQNSWQSHVPPLFMVEIEELPRAADIEWHAHVGIAGAQDGSVEMFHHANLEPVGWQAWHMLVREDGLVFVHTILALSKGGEDLAGDHSPEGVYHAALQAVGVNASGTTPLQAHLKYVDASSVDPSKLLLAPGAEAVIPCHSIWGPGGERLSVVALFRRVLQRQDD